METNSTSQYVALRVWGYVVARIGENVQAIKDAKGGELSEESSETDGTEVDAQKNENRSILYALVGATIILAVVFILAFWVFK